MYLIILKNKIIVITLNKLYKKRIHWKLKVEAVKLYSRKITLHKVSERT